VDVGIVAGLEDRIGRDVDLDAALGIDADVLKTGEVEDARLLQVLGDIN
jgi:hypothetical protein